MNEMSNTNEPTIPSEAKNQSNNDAELLREARRRAKWLHDHNAPSNWCIVTTEEAAELKREIAELREDREIAELRAEVERERMRLAACGVVANANTPESAAKAREMHPDYRSASCGDVARAVDREIQLRAALDAARNEGGAK